MRIALGALPSNLVGISLVADSSCESHALLARQNRRTCLRQVSTRRQNCQASKSSLTLPQSRDKRMGQSGMVEPTLEQFGKWKQAGIVVKYLHCDNAGKNMSLEKRAQSSDWQFAITFEYTVQDTPQQNHLAKLGFAVLAAHGCTLMHWANISKAM
eukprot:15324682-Ditylum_brightwellii.AAC.1